MKVFDCFTFFNELDLLEIRLNYLNDVVDYFVLVEADKTHSGKPKPYHYEENKEMFKDFNHKIIHVKAEFDIENLNFEPATEYNPDDDYWKLENRQRNHIVNGLNDAKDNDIIIISDVDEIPHKDLIPLYKPDKAFRPKVSIQRLSYYYMNYVFDYKWYGSVFTRKSFLDKTTPQKIRGAKNTYHTFKGIKCGGWHFSYLGGIDSIITKLRSFAHSEYSGGEYVEKDFIKNRVLNGKSLFDNNKLKLSNEELPDYIEKNKEKYRKYFITDYVLKEMNENKIINEEDDERFKKFLGNRIGGGASRFVYSHKEDKDVVIKQNKINDTKQNPNEWMCWNLAKKLGEDHWLAPCLGISKSGNYLIQKREEPISPKEVPKDIPDWLKIDYQNSNQWVKINNKIVMCDYGSSQYQELKKKIKQ